MDAVDPRDLMRPFESLQDPRSHNIIHPLPNLVLITVMAVICGAGDYVTIAQWARAKQKWLATFLDLSKGLPSHDTFNRFFAALNPESFERCFLSWIAELARTSDGRLVAVDGKTLRRSFEAANGPRMAAIHMVSAWCERNRLVLGQLAVEDKSNEITAIPKLLEALNIKGATVSIDAMGCQKEIAAAIRAGGGNYLLAVKDNHPTLHEDIRFFFDDAIAQGDAKLVRLPQPQVDAGHDRIETRQAWASGEVGWLKRQGHDWKDLAGIVCVECQRQTLADGKSSVQRRYYLTSHDPRTLGAERMLEMVRGHWGVENRLHWSLDVSFNEDQRRIRKGHGAENFSRLCRMALNLLKSEKTLKAGINTKRLNCGWDHAYLLKVLMNLG